MSAQHTPGPWQMKYREAFGGGLYFDSVVDATGDSVRVDGMTLTSGPVARANAQLIAAAPDLLKALQLVLADCQDIDTDSCISLGVGEHVLAAINKATGGATP